MLKDGKDRLAEVELQFISKYTYGVKKFNGDQDYFIIYDIESKSVTLLDYKTNTEQITAILPNDFFDKTSQMSWYNDLFSINLSYEFADMMSAKSEEE